MKLKYVVTLVVTVISLSSYAFTQAERLSDAEYTAVLTKALDAASSRDRRVLTEEIFYTGAQVAGTRTIVSDFAGPDAKRVQVTEEFKEKRSSSDSITISGQFFCRDDKKGWKRATKECAKGGKMMAIPDGAYQYSVERDPNNSSRKTYTRRATFTDSGSSERDAVRMKFIEIKFTTDESGAITDYTETRRGGIEPNGWSSVQVTRYEYEPRDLKITDPTKEN